MNDALTFWTPLLGRALVHSLWQDLLVGALAAVALHALRGARPQARYLVACLALLACLVAPVATVLRLAGPTAAPGAFVVIDAETFATPRGMPGFGIDALLPWIVVAWAAGVLVFGLRMLMGIAWVDLLRRGADRSPDGDWQARLDVLATRIGLRVSIPLHFVDGLDTPVTTGWWRPVVLMPAALAARMPVSLLEALLAHELAHIRRHDYLVNLLQGAVEALLFYHPVTWWLSRRIRAERELVADGIAIDALGDPRRLAVALSQLSDFPSAAAPVPDAALAAHGGELMSRIQHLIRPNAPLGGNRLAVPAIALLGLSIAVYAHARVAPPAAKAVVTVPAAPAQAPVLMAGPMADTAQSAQAVADAASAIRAGEPPAPRRARAATHAERSDIDHDVADAVRDALADSHAARADAGRLRAYRHVGTTLDGDGLLFDRDGRTYRVTDPALVARADRAWADTRELGTQMQTLGREMGERGEALGALGRELGQRIRPVQTEAMRDAQARLNALSREYGRLAGRRALSEDDAADAAADARLRALEADIERESARIAEAAERSVAGPVADLERQMEEASRPMKALELRMQALAERQRAASDVAEREVDGLIDEALTRGLAQPVETTRR